MSDSSQYSQGSQSSAPQQQLRRLASPTQDRPPHEIVRPRLEESATREAVRAADQLQPDEQPAEQPANERANAPVNEPARQGDQQANQPPNEVTDERAGLRAEIAEMTKAIAADRKERQRLNELAAAARAAESEQLALQYETRADNVQQEERLEDARAPCNSLRCQNSNNLKTEQGMNLSACQSSRSKVTRYVRLMARFRRLSAGLEG